MAQQALHHTATLPDTLAYLDKPSESHVFLFSIYLGVIATWAFTFFLALNFHSY